MSTPPAEADGVFTNSAINLKGILRDYSVIFRDMFKNTVSLSHNPTCLIHRSDWRNTDRN